MTLPIDPRDTDTATSRRPRRWLWAAGGVAAVLLAGAGTAYALAPSSDDKAVEQCQDAIRDKLFSPSTAVFADEVKQNNKPPVFRISGELDAQNKLGGTLRAEYFCVLQLNDDGSWQTLEARTITR